MQSKWRRRAEAVIGQALAEAKERGMTPAETRRHVSAAYPFGAREAHPYKIWLDAVKKATGPPAPAKPARSEPGGTLFDGVEIPE